MKFQVYLPCDQLLPYVKHLIISENENANTYQVLPDTALVIGFQYQGRLAYLTDDRIHPLATAGITGLRDTCRVFQNTVGTGSVLVVFRENGAARFLRQPLHELFGESLSLEQFFHANELAELEEKLVNAIGDHDRIKLVEHFLIGHLNARPADLLVTRALEYIHQSKGTIRMSELASLLHTRARMRRKINR